MTTDPLLNQIVWLIQSMPLSTIQDGTATSDLLQTIFLRLRDYLRQSPPETVSENANTVWGILGLHNPEEVAEQFRPSLADLAWTAMRRTNGFIGGSDTWLVFLRLGSWDIARTMPERDPRLWWINELPMVDDITEKISPQDVIRVPNHPQATRSPTLHSGLLSAESGSDMV
ncbi:hypothetical protein BDN72DRAFT_265677 [Pluteus cervinus]|uniref:Uncharacterized protein n=1 Tax=Pluteus cervinus TaxID=181527 RepID=A0ACD3AES0_9AGAR|nr:hypothetical protein BDN72DRAFT_265677 [Pluteus cervinus]